MSHKKFGPDRFSRFDVYWIQTNKQTNRQTDRQTDKPNLYIDILKPRVVFELMQCINIKGRGDRGMVCFVSTYSEVLLNCSGSG